MAFGKKEVVAVTPPKFGHAIFEIIGESPLVIHKFSQKAREGMKAKQEAGSTAKKGKQREGKDFNELYNQAFHVSTDGWNGIPAAAFRAAMISACRIVGFTMTRAKLAIFIEQDGLDADEGTPLVKIEGKPEKMEMYVRLETGVADICVRPMWRKWSAKVRVRFDETIMTLSDITNLLLRAGMQVGIGEGRPDSRKSCGMGWGTFTIKNDGGKK